MTALDQLRRVEVADVLLAGQPVAELRRTPGGVVFRYRPEYIADGGRPVATTLPVTDGDVISPSGAVPPYFAGLLPEGRRLNAIRTATKTSADDELTLLLAVGGDAVGEVQVVPQGAQARTDDEGATPVDGPGDVSFAELFARATGSDPHELDLVALPGVQDKISGQMIAFPVAGPSGRYFLKLDPPELPHLVANEAFFLAAARVAGVPAATATPLTDRDGRAGLLVERFDREVDAAGRLVRLGQEDGCQVLGRYPADKYLVTAEEVVAGLAAVTRAPVVAARQLLRQLAFAYLTGNGDAHAKNLSVRRLSGGEWMVTPAYDVPSSSLYGDTTMALSITGRDREDITWRTFVELGERTGVREPAVRSTLAELTSRVDRWLGDLDQLPFDPHRIHRLRRLIDDRRAKLAPQ